jgi:two-component system cell cycle response regulator DivK
MTQRLFRVLIVEDDPTNVELFRTVLEREGYAVGTVGNGAQVEALVQTARPDLILMDINLPGVSGTELLGRLRRNRSTAGLRIIALTAHAMKGDDEMFMAAGFDGYIPKPVDLKTFRRIVRQAFESWRQRGGANEQ